MCFNVFVFYMDPTIMQWVELGSDLEVYLLLNQWPLYYVVICEICVNSNKFNQCLSFTTLDELR